jgi:hypothetical protein
MGHAGRQLQKRVSSSVASLTKAVMTGMRSLKAGLVTVMAWPGMVGSDVANDPGSAAATEIQAATAAVQAESTYSSTTAAMGSDGQTVEPTSLWVLDHAYYMEMLDLCE